MNSILIVINDAPYGNEKAYNALRLAISIQKDFRSVQVNVFLMADAAFCALPAQKTADGYYNIERMLKSVVAKGGKVKVCGGCAQSRGIDTIRFIEGVEMSNMKEFTQWVVESEKLISF